MSQSFDGFARSSGAAVIEIREKGVHSSYWMTTVVLRRDGSTAHDHAHISFQAPGALGALRGSLEHAINLG